MTPFFDDDGTEINPDLIPKPDLCLICKKQDDSKEEIFCSLNRIDQRNDNEFKCFAFENINED
jgi:hypothetical protein